METDGRHSADGGLEMVSAPDSELCGPPPAMPLLHADIAQTALLVWAGNSRSGCQPWFHQAPPQIDIELPQTVTVVAAQIEMRGDHALHKVFIYRTICLIKHII